MITLILRRLCVRKTLTERYGTGLNVRTYMHWARNLPFLHEDRLLKVYFPFLKVRLFMIEFRY